MVLALGGSPRLVAWDTVLGVTISRLYQEATAISFIHCYSR